jgi:hypothetical protein
MIDEDAIRQRSKTARRSVHGQFETCPISGVARRFCRHDARLILLKPSVNKTAGIVHRSKIYPAMAAVKPLSTLSACPLRFDRVRIFAPQRIDAVAE